jgi:hypothetical protein
MVHRELSLPMLDNAKAPVSWAIKSDMIKLPTMVVVEGKCDVCGGFQVIPPDLIRVAVDRLKLHFGDEGFRARLVDLVKITPVAVGGISREKLG